MSELQRPGLSDRLLRYSAAASLIGSGILLTGNQSALAAGIAVTIPNTTIYANEDFAINMDNDTANSTPEFYLSITSRWSSTYGIWVNRFQQAVEFRGATSMAIWTFPIPLNYGDTIGTSGLWNGAGQVITSSGSVRGNWANLSGIHYLGVRFTADDSLTHYGWVELEVTDAFPGPQQVVIHRYAYETTPNQYILAGHTTPASVSLSSTQAVGGVQGIVAAGLAALGGALTWLRRKLGKA